MQHNLINLVYDRLHAADSKLAQRYWKDAIMYEDDNDLIQMKWLNSYWQKHLGLLDVDTINVRSKLIGDIKPEYWISNFNRYVLNTVVTHGVPFGAVVVKH